MPDIPAPPAPDPVEVIADGDVPVAYVIRHHATATATTFIAPDDAGLQSGFVVFGAGTAVQPHVHPPIERRSSGTAEFLLVRSGRCLADVYAEDRRLLATRELVAGDAILSLRGGHGFRMLEDTVLLEVKQGPYLGDASRVRFEP